MKLKPCPFCGGEANVASTSSLCALVYCTKCFAQTEVFGGEQSEVRAVEAWNRRVNNEAD